MRLAVASSVSSIPFMRLIRPILLVVICLVTVSLRAQSDVPRLIAAFPGQALAPGGSAVTIDVRNYISVPGVRGTQFALFDTNLGRFAVELRNDAAPRHVANFLQYVQANLYTNSVFHRSDTFDNGPNSIVQGGGFRAVGDTFPEIPKFAPIALEYNLPNARGTLAAARTNELNSATSEWYFNTRDNTDILGRANNGGYSVFGRVLGTGMTVVDAIAALPHLPNSVIPARDANGGLVASNLVIVSSVREATLFPTGGGPSVLSVSVQVSAPGIIDTLLSGSTLTMTPINPGSANVTVRVVDTNGNAAEGTFTVSVAGSAPVYVAQPMSQAAAAGSTVVFNAPATGAASYRWEHNGSTLAGASTATLVLNDVSAAHAGTYQSFATNSLGDAASAIATLTVIASDPINAGRLVNLSILTSAGSGAKVLTMGAFVGPVGATGGLPLVIRGVGPTLALPPFNISGVLPDPVMNFYAAGNPTPLETNDNWGGSASVAAAFRSVAAFDLPANSLDSAIIRSAADVLPGGYTVQVTGKENASGVVIAEIYEGAGDPRTATSPRLINLSTLAQIDPNSDLAVGFVLGGLTARTVLVRGVGPSLAAFGIDGLMADPRLELFDNNTGARVASNDDWAGSLEIAATGNSVGAFPLSGGGSKDAVLLVTLPPGPYSARISGAGGAGGTAIVEVYEVR
jgi:cyclophilin family peptidyl-prolyl cis-trans isomerase